MDDALPEYFKDLNSMTNSGCHGKVLPVSTYEGVKTFSETQARNTLPNDKISDYSKIMVFTNGKLTCTQMTNFRFFQTEIADDNFEFTKNGGKFSKRIARKHDGKRRNCLF